MVPIRFEHNNFLFLIVGIRHRRQGSLGFRGLEAGFGFQQG